jgi:class 3 adenylate cyclase
MHAMLDSDLQISMAAKMITQQFSGQSWFQDFGKISPSETRERINDFLKQNIGFGPELHEIEKTADKQAMAQNLQKRQKKYETLQEWDGPFSGSAAILNTLREDTQQIIHDMLTENEKLERCWLCFYSEALQPFRECQRSLDSNAATTVVNLSRILNPGQIAPVFDTMFAQTERPVYLLAISSNKRFYLFLRDELKTSQASVMAFNLQNIAAIRSVKDGSLFSIEIETPQDLLKLPMLHPDDASQAIAFLREKSVEAIEAQEEFIDRDFDKELKKLDMLFKARAITNSEYIFRKSRLQKMELEKFSDANIELLLAKRFSDSSKGEKFDEQLLKKFTFEKTVMFTDIVGFSSKASQKQLLDTMTLLAVHDKLLMPLVKNYDGILIKKIGDALMIRFDEALKACNAAREMQARLFDFNRRSNEKIFIRIGINTGTVFVKNDDVFGDAVNVAARMETLAKPGRIFITEATMQQLNGRVPCESLGLHQIKGKAEPIQVYSLADSSSQADEMARMATELMHDAGIKSSENTVSESAQSQTPASRQPSYPDSMVAQIDTARALYIDSVKTGRKRHPELEEWFAHFEEYLRNSL